MGELIEKYGYFGTGETLVVADPEEGWVMEMCGYDMNGTGGVWVAQRVPDDGFLWPPISSASATFARAPKT